MKFVKLLLLVLLIYFIICAGLVRLIPQRESVEFYQQQYSKPVAWIMLSTDLHQFFRSPLFLLPVSVFLFLLAFCTITEIIERFRYSTPKIFGHDIIHIGVILLIIAGGVSFYTRKEEMVYLQKGESVLLPGGYKLVVTAFDYAVYKDKRPKAWKSIVEIFKDGKTLSTATLEVNKPLRIGTLKVYPHSFRQHPYVTVTGGDTRKGMMIRARNKFETSSKICFFEGLKQETVLKDSSTDDFTFINTAAVFYVSTPKEDTSPGTQQYTLSESIDNFILEDFFTQDFSGILVVSDPGGGPMMFSFILITLGLILSFFQHINKQKL